MAKQPTITQLRAWVKRQLNAHTRTCRCDNCTAARAVKASMQRAGDWKK